MTNYVSNLYFGRDNSYCYSSVRLTIGFPATQDIITDSVVTSHIFYHASRLYNTLTERHANIKKNLKSYRLDHYHTEFRCNSSNTIE